MGKVPPDNVKARMTRDLITYYPISRIESVVEAATTRNNVDPLLIFYKKFGDILDANGYGLKLQLQRVPEYYDALAALTTMSVTLRLRKRKIELIQGNVDRLINGEYGLNSGIVLRDMLKTSRQRSSNESDLIHSAVLGLEALENIFRQFLTYGLQHLDKKWKPQLNFEPLRSPDVQLMLGAVPRLSKKKFGVLHSFRDMINRQGQKK
jgi:hypothetical protein